MEYKFFYEPYYVVPGTHFGGTARTAPAGLARDQPLAAEPRLPGAGTLRSPAYDEEFSGYGHDKASHAREHPDP